MSSIADDSMTFNDFFIFWRWYYIISVSKWVWVSVVLELSLTYAAWYQNLLVLFWNNKKSHIYSTKIQIFKE